MQERLTQAIEDRSIELELGAYDLDLDTLAELLRNLPSRSRQIFGHAYERGGPQLEDATLELGDTTVDPIEAIGDLGILGVSRDASLELARAQDDLADRGEKAIEGVGADAHRRIQGLGSRRSGACRRCGRIRFRRLARRVRSGL